MSWESSPPSKISPVAPTPSATPIPPVSSSGRAGHESLAGKNRRPTQSQQRPHAVLHRRAMLIVALMCWLFVWRESASPSKRLRMAPNIFPKANLVPDRSALPGRSWRPGSFLQRHEPPVALGQRRIVTWAKTLEDRVEQKTMNSIAPTITCCTWKRWLPSARWRRWWRTRLNNRSLDSYLLQADPKVDRVGSNRTRETRRGDAMSRPDRFRKPPLWRSHQELAQPLANLAHECASPPTCAP